MEHRAITVYMQVDGGDITNVGEGMATDQADVAAFLRELAREIDREIEAQTQE